MRNFVQNIIGFSLRNRFFVFFMTLILIVSGVISYQNTPIEAFPDVTNPRVRIISQWPGRSAEEIEKLVTLPIEIEVNSTPGKTEVRSISLFGLSVVTIAFGDDVDEFKARQLVANRIMNVDLPEGVDSEMEPSSGPTGEIYRYTLKSDKLSVRELKTLQDWTIERKLRAVPGVADIVSFGGEVKIFEVSADPHLMQQYDITSLELFEALERSNVNVGGDVIEKRNQAYVVRGLGLLNNKAEIENVIIERNNNTTVLVKNVAQVKETFAPKLGIVGLNDDPDLVEGIVVMRRGENPSEVIERLKLKIEELNERVLPEGTSIDPFYDRSELIDFTTNTVTKNLAEGIFFVVVFVLLFMADWRTTFIVSIIIPLSLLFALVCMRIKGMSANLLSLGAVDFGIIIDGAVVMVEGLFVILDRKAKSLGMERFNKLSKLGLIKEAGSKLGANLFSSQMITILALVPIFAFQKVEGKMFSPLAFTFGFALLGALIMSLTLVPVLVSVLLNKNVSEKENFFTRFMQKIFYGAFSWAYARKKLTLMISGAVFSIGMFFGSQLGTEFLPQLNEGAIYIRAFMPISVSLTESYDMTQKLREEIRTIPEVRGVLSQTGRPNDGTDPTGFFNIEFHVDLYPQEEWNRGLTKQEIISELEEKLNDYQGVSFNFSQPIMDNVEEAVTGVKGALALKIYGNDLFQLEELAEEAKDIMEGVEGIADLNVIKLIGQPELRIDLNQERLAMYGVATADAQSVIEMAIGGKAATQLYEEERRFDIRIRYKEEYRSDIQEIGNIKVPTLDGGMVQLREIADITTQTGPAFVYRSGGERFVAITFSVRGRDLGGAVAEAKEKVESTLQLDKGMYYSWDGEFKNMERAQNRLKQVVPIVMVLIFLVLLTTFNNVKDASLVMMNVPFALVGGILGLTFFTINFGISAGVGFIALFGICVQNGVLLVSKFKSNIQEGMSLDDAVHQGVKSRIRPVLMTAVTDFVGLLPASMSTGIGSESQKPLAVVIVWGILTATILTLIVFPVIFSVFYKKKSI
ncbi:CusA/CzcA family heavy metal efflux RND transporter [Flammeovirga sp. SubArs3]|uniref:efflux RND transporter permease subunit n=1 Tax=Flammeovirga sp. SubArs3 TaxID=2995316 RepID=UPI00248CD6BF|nr:CusA/CzcA family heavy metal efflux RND transporter [Flammeovirga sp. SubArs3]